MSKLIEVPDDFLVREPIFDGINLVGTRNIDLSFMPSVDLVRCRECKRWDTDPDSYGKDDGPKGKCMKLFEETYDDDFCSYGQRKIETLLPKSDAKDESLEVRQ